ncbi:MULTISPECIES: hypothetical protein [unclassified Streptomyces]|uniref:hypothetical protein n=1 Tax=unclassified Streptomyces TaxID=2593676 RepID=UPI003D8E241B
MMVKSRLKAAGIAAAATMVATGGLIATAPSASAYGNCYHYGMAGYAQVFTDDYYNGNCYEWRIGEGHYLPSYMAWKVSSLRSWPLYPGQMVKIGNDYNTFSFYAGDWQPSAYSSWDNNTDLVR